MWSIQIALLRLESFPAPASKTYLLKKEDRTLVDITFVDSPKISLDFVDDMINPMLRVMQNHMGSAPYHARIVVYGQGFPASITNQHASAIAAYIPAEDIFIVDLNKTYQSKPKDFPIRQWIAFLMGHEATHLWQAKRGDDMSKGWPKGLLYNSDKHEREAFQEGQNVANSLGFPQQIAWKFKGESAFVTPSPNPYWFMPFDKKPDIHISYNWTLRGKALSLWNWVRSSHI